MRVDSLISVLSDYGADAEVFVGEGPSASGHVDLDPTDCGSVLSIYETRGNCDDAHCVSAECEEPEPEPFDPSIDPERADTVLSLSAAIAQLDGDDGDRYNSILAIEAEILRVLAQ